MKLLISLSIGALAVAVVSSNGRAQAETPAPGAWGVEGSLSGANMLKFRSASSAWVLGFDGAFVHQADDGTVGNQNVGTMNLRAGFRRYSVRAGRVRPFSTISAILGFASDGGGDRLTAGPVAELGAAYFFSPHVSLGGSGSLSAIYQARGGGFSTFALSARAFSLLGAVYF
jgi:hypothetical protein